jgi:hypothetical protein
MTYEIDDDDYFFEGIATKMGEFFQYGDEAWYLAPGAFDASRGESEVKLLAGHDESEVYGSPRKRPEVSIAEAATIAFARLCRELDLSEDSAPDNRPPAIRSNR